jgi:hypothetical protein
VPLPDDRCGVGSGELDALRQPPPRHAHRPERVSSLHAVEVGKHPQGQVAGVDHESQAIDADDGGCVGAARGKRVGRQGWRHQNEMRTAGPLDPRATSGGVSRLDQILDRFDCDLGTQAVTDDGHGLRGVELAQQPREVVGFGGRAVVAFADRGNKPPLLRAWPREDDRACTAARRADARHLPGNRQTLRLGVVGLVVVAVDEDHQRPRRIIEQVREVRPLPAAAASLLNVGCCLRGQAADAGQPPRAHQPDIGIGAGCSLTPLLAGSRANACEEPRERREGVEKATG